MTDRDTFTRKNLASKLGDAALDQVTGGATPYGTTRTVRNGDEIDGGAGDDILVGHSGNDTVDGRTGNDVLTGDRGNDRLAGGFGGDTFIINPGDGNDTVLGTGETALGEWLTRGDVDKIVINGVDWDNVRIEFTKGGLSGEVQADGTQKLQTNSAGIIWFGDQKVEFRGIERTQLPNDQP